MNCSNDPNRSYWSRLEATWKEKYLPSFRTSDILYELLQTTFKQPSRLSDLQNTYWLFEQVTKGKFHPHALNLEQDHSW